MGTETALADPEKLREIARQMEGGIAYLPDYVCELWARPVFVAAAEIAELRAKLAAAEAERGEPNAANRYHQSLGAKWMVEAIVREYRTRFALNRNAQSFADDLERRWENEAFWRPGAPCTVCGAEPATYCAVCGASCHEECSGTIHDHAPKAEDPTP